MDTGNDNIHRYGSRLYGVFERAARPREQGKYIF